MSVNTQAKIQAIHDIMVVHIPLPASQTFPSRSQLFLTGTFAGKPFSTIAEPDGKGSHWFTPDNALLAATKTRLGDSIELELESSKDWPQPELPNDFATMLANDTVARATWDKATPMAHWEWLRWVNSTTNPETRAKRIDVSQSKLAKGMRRPCCFNRNMCCVPEVSKSGVLLPTND